MIDSDLDKKLRIIQSKIIREENNTCSYSRVINDMLKRGIK